jgi:tRNA (guanosine-2'-O-)-methyltransferase
VLGHERTGIPPEALELLDVAVEIPMIGTGASLNVAVAGSLVLYRLAGSPVLFMITKPFACYSTHYPS